MKTILFILIAILAGFAATSSYAQSIDCQQAHVAGTCPGDNPYTSFILTPTDDESCNGYDHGTSFITACLDSSNVSGNVQYNIESNYPMVCTSHQRLDGTVVVTCRPKCVLMYDPMTGRRWYKCPDD